MAPIIQRGCLPGLFALSLLAGPGAGGEALVQGRRPPAEHKPERLLRPALYSPYSPFNRRIPPSAEVDARSPIMVRSLLKASKSQGFVVAVRSWTVPVYFAGARTPRHDVVLTADWAPSRRMRSVPIPDHAAPDPEDDASMAVIDPARGCEYDFWGAHRSAGGWTARWANSIRLNGAGVYPRGLSARGSGFALLAGMIWPEELERGRIEHALVVTYPFTKAGGPVAPATESDGSSTRQDAIPEGARIQLDPALDLDSLALRPYEKVIARCLQEYGMFVGDSGGGIELEAVHPMSARRDPYRGLLPDEEIIPLDNIPVDRLRILELPPQLARTDGGLAPSGCAQMD